MKAIIPKEKSEWMNQKKLYNAFSQLFKGTLVESEKKIPYPTKERPKNNLRIDIAVEYKGVKFAVEYDGPMHYVKTKKAKKDLERIGSLKEKGYEVIHFPYYLELDEDSFRSLFKNFSDLFKEEIIIEYEDKHVIHHGFEETEWLPVDFCPLGIERFCEESKLFSKKIKDDIFESLEKVSKEELKVKMEYIVPPKILRLIRNW